METVTAIERLQKSLDHWQSWCDEYRLFKEALDDGDEEVDCQSMISKGREIEFSHLNEQGQS